jgi:hypothetical protein
LKFSKILLDDVGGGEITGEMENLLGLKVADEREQREIRRE